jgi:RNAse (barnase) inhibitor barstar
MLYSDHNVVTLPEKDQFLAVLDGKRCKTIEALYVQLNAALELPDYFGANLDALFDCLCDLTWIEQKHVVIVITRSELLLSSGSADQRMAVIETLREAETNQQVSDRSLEVLLLGHDKG